MGMEVATLRRTSRVMDIVGRLNLADAPYTFAGRHANESQNHDKRGGSHDTRLRIHLYMQLPLPAIWG